MRDKLRSDGVLAAVLILALAAQMPHAAAVFARLAPGAGWLGAAHAAAYALALEGAILIFVMRGRRWTSVGFAACSVAVNLAYYWPAFVAPAALLVSVALPVAIALYSHEMAAHAQDATEPEELPADEEAVIVERPQPRAELPAEPTGVRVELRCSYDGCAQAATPCPQCDTLRCAKHAGSHARYACRVAVPVGAR